MLVELAASAAADGVAAWIAFFTVLKAETKVSGVSALKNWPRLLTAACQRSATLPPSVAMLGQAVVPAAMLGKLPE